MELITFERSSILVLLFFLLSCGNKETDRQTEKKQDSPLSLSVVLSPEQMKNAGIVLQCPVQQEIAHEIQVNGMLDVPPQNLHSIGARVPGMVKSTALLQGSHVHRGDVLCVLENPDFLNWQQEYIGNSARLEMLQNDLKRQQGLAEKNLASQKVLQQVQADFRILEAAQNALRRKLKLTGFSLAEIEKGNFSAELPVVSPADGFVTGVFVNTGQVLAEGAALCELVNMEHIHAELMVFEKDVVKIKPGQDVEFELVSRPAVPHKAKVFLVNHKISKERTVQVHAHLDEILPEFLPNMQINARIRTEGKLEWVLPSEALVSDGRQSGVYIEAGKPGTFRFLPLQVCGSEGNMLAVKFPEGYQPENLRMVVKGAYDVKAVAEKSASVEE